MRIKGKPAKRIIKFAVLAVILAGIAIFGGVFASMNPKKAVAKSGQSSDSGSSDSIVIMVKSGPVADAMKSAITTYEQQTGRNVEIQEISQGDYLTVMASTLLAGSSEIDIAMIPNNYGEMLSRAGTLQPLDNYLYNDQQHSQAYLGDFFQIYSYDGQTYLIPIDISTNLIYYRSDLITAPPETWDEYLEIAKQFTKKYNSNSPTEWGASLSCSIPEDLTADFDTILWSFGGEVIDQKGNIKLDDANSVKAGNYFVQLMDSGVMSPQILSWTYDDVIKNLLNGNTAMAAPFTSSAVSDIKNSDSIYKNKIKCALIPGTITSGGSVDRVPIQQCWTFGLNINSMHKEAAWEFLNWFLTSKAGMDYVNAGGIPPRLSVLLDHNTQSAHPEYKLLMQSLFIGRSETDTQYYSGVINEEADALKNVLEGNALKQEFNTAAQKLKQLVSE
jgi:multiple sugar transport system substrate-binding protein